MDVTFVLKMATNGLDSFYFFPIFKEVFAEKLTSNDDFSHHDTHSQTINDAILTN